MSKTDIVLIKPGAQRQLYGELSSFQLTAIEPPLWGALLAAVLREQGHAVELLDAEVEGWSHAETARQVAAIDPLLSVVVVTGSNPSASTPNMVGAGQIVRELRRHAPGVRTALCGLHPSALPRQTLEQEDVDFVCVGEGFVTLPALIEAVRAGHPGPVVGAWRWIDGQPTAGPPAPLTADLDALPMPAWDLLPMARYRAHNWHCFDDIEARQPYAVIYTSLGCPFSCSFCCTNALFGRRGIRYRSPERVIDEIDWLVQRHGVRNIKILDEMFVLKRSHVLGLCDRIVERGHELNIWAYARVNTVTPELLARLRAAGINWVAYGFESGSKAVLDGVAKGYRPEQIQSVVEMTRAEGLYIGGNFIFGLPDDDLQSMEATLALARQILPEWANFYATMAYPGSQLYEQALREGWPLPDSWQGYSQYAVDTLPLPTRHLSGPEVLAFRDAAFQRYFTDPRYLDRVARTFGPATRGYIEQMTRRRLTRTHVPAPAAPPAPAVEPAHAPC